MRIPLSILITLMFGACDTPGPEFAGVPAERQHVGKSVFDVRLKGDLAQAIRVNSEWAPRSEAVWPRAVIAIEQASGCRVRRMEGDQVVIKARLDCPDGAPAQTQPREIRCDVDVLNDVTIRATCMPGV